jgi:uncharacterized protein
MTEKMALSRSLPSSPGAQDGPQLRRTPSNRAVIEWPFAPSGASSRLEGREAIREYSRQVMASPLRFEDFEVAELYQTQDPEVVIVEVRARVTLTTTGQSLAATSIQVLRIRDGQIVLFRDFADSRVLEDVIGEPGPGRRCSQEMPD